MRTVLLLPYTVIATAILGCGSESSERTTASLLERDLTLAAPSPKVEVVSAVELQQPRARQTRRQRTTVRQSKLAVTRVAAPARVASPGPAVAEPASTKSEPVSDRELLPGKTVTVIPTSSGPSPAPAWDEEFPETRRGPMVRGGRCPTRGRPGIGIATRPRPTAY